MSRKQEIYQEILRRALPQVRNSLAYSNEVHEPCVLSRDEQMYLKGAYEVAQFVHNLYVSILDAEWVFHDIWFLNVQARSFVERNSDQTAHQYSLFVACVRELFSLVPDEWRPLLEWTGPAAESG